MPELDCLKEKRAYQFWQGITVVTEISFVGRLISTVETAHRALWSVAAVGAVIALAFGVFGLHRQIERRIDQVGKL